MHAKLTSATDHIAEVLLGKQELIRLAVCCLLSGGHLLLEDLPGVGKTTLAQALAKVFGLDFARVQFTSDLLPADIIGLSLFDKNTNQFEFRPGPVFSQLLLADEINRATPKTQSALLEAMAEHQVSNDGNTYALPQPFFVVATQNPERHGGTFALPESQLDRFSMRLSIGYPSAEAERLLLSGQRVPLSRLAAHMSSDDLMAAAAAAAAVRIEPVCLDYIQRLIAHSRNHTDISLGLSPRAALTLVSAAKSWAYLDGRDFVRATDVQAVFVAIAAHRLRDSADNVAADGRLAELLLDSTDVVA